MTAVILPFKKSKSAVKLDNGSFIRPQTKAEIFLDIRDDIILEWQRFATKNKLNDFILSKLPSHCKGVENTDYVNDLNALSNVERLLNMKVAVFYPGCVQNSQFGWLAAFHFDDEIFSTPPDIMSEANARALNIVLYLTFVYRLKTLKIS